VVSGFDKRGTNYENVWEHGNIGQYWKGTREQAPPLGDPQKPTSEMEHILLTVMANSSGKPVINQLLVVFIIIHNTLNHRITRIYYCPFFPS